MVAKGPMLKKCLTRQLSPLQSQSFTSPSRTLFARFGSSATKPSRRFSEPDDFAKSRRLGRTFLIGAVAGLVLYQGYLYYDRQRDQNSFVSYTLLAREPVSSTASIFHLAPVTNSTEYEVYEAAWRKGIWNFHIKQPQIQIMRAYTPLPPVDVDSDDDGKRIRFLIRHDPHGEVSSYLHRLPIGSTIEMRGPNLEYHLSPDIRQVVFFAGGTGIAPALQIANAMFDKAHQAADQSEDARKSRKLHILWASRRREDCEGGVSDAPADAPKPLTTSFGRLFGKARPNIRPPTGTEKGVIVRELEGLKQKYPGQVTVEYFVNAEGTWIDENTVFDSLSRFDDTDFSKGSPSSSEQRQILISGPSGFITHLAGPKEWRGGREEQGSVSRIIAHAIAENPHHVKVWKV